MKIITVLMMLCAATLGQAQYYNNGYYNGGYYNNNSYSYQMNQLYMQQAYRQNRLSRVTSGLEVGRIRHQMYREYSEWQLEKKEIDRDRMLATAIANYEFKQRKEALREMGVLPRLPIPDPAQSGIYFNGKQYTSYAELRKDPEWISHITDRSFDREVEAVQEAMIYKAAMAAGLRDHHPEEYYKMKAKEIVHEIQELKRQ